MAAVAKFNQVTGTLIKEEAAYGTAETLADASDGATEYVGDGDLAPPTTVDYVYDGSLGRAPGTLAPQKRTTPNGRYRMGQFRALPKGAGTAYTSSAVLPPREVHRWLKAAGYDATFSTDRWLYTPTTHGAGYTSLTHRQYAQGFQYDQAGVIADFGYETQGLGVPIWTFDWRGLSSALPTDLALPAITYAATTVIPPVSAAVVSNIGTFAFGVSALRKVSFKRNRKIDTPRLNQILAGGHAGFVPGGASPTIEMEIERTALVGTPFHTTGGIDGEALMAAATSVAINLTYVGGTGNNWKHDFAQAQCTKVTPGADGPLALVTLTFAAHASTPAANDFETITLY